jgi:hypothetical protein
MPGSLWRSSTAMIARLAKARGMRRCTYGSDAFHLASAVRLDGDDILGATGDLKRARERRSYDRRGPLLVDSRPAVTGHDAAIGPESLAKLLELGGLQRSS